MSAQNQTTQKFISDARTLSQKVEALTAKVETLEKTIPALIQNIGKALDGHKTKQDFMAEWMDAVVGCVGVETVQAAVLTTRLKKAQAEAEAIKAETEALKASGELVPQDVVDDNSYVVLTEVESATNEPVGPGWFRLHMSEVRPEFRELLMGKPSGYSESRANTTFTVVEILKAVNPSESKPIVAELSLPAESEPEVEAANPEVVS